MTATVTYHPRVAMGCDRINARAAAENIADERAEATYTDPRVVDEVARYENYRTAKAVLRSPNWYGADVVHAALEFVHEYENAVPRREPEPVISEPAKQLAALVIGGLLAIALAVWGL